MNSERGVTGRNGVGERRGKTGRDGGREGKNRLMGPWNLPLPTNEDYG